MRRVVLVLFVLVLVVSGANVALALSKPDPAATRALGGPGGAAVEAVVREVPLALGYDHRDLAAGLRAATAVMTTGFAAEYRTTFRRTAAPQARQRQEVTDAVVRRAGLVRVDGEDRAVCVVFVDLRLLATGGRTLDRPRTTRRSRLRVTLQRVDGEWLLAGLRTL